MPVVSPDENTCKDVHSFEWVIYYIIIPISIPKNNIIREDILLSQHLYCRSELVNFHIRTPNKVRKTITKHYQLNEYDWVKTIWTVESIYPYKVKDKQNIYQITFYHMKSLSTCFWFFVDNFNKYRMPSNLYTLYITVSHSHLMERKL